MQAGFKILGVLAKGKEVRACGEGRKERRADRQIMPASISLDLRRGNVARGQTFWTLTDGELDLLAFVQSLVSVGLDG